MTSSLVQGQHIDKLFWFSLGVFLVAASHITYRQLETFKKRCEVKPARQKDTVDKSTENEFYENDSDYVLSLENEHKLCSVEACKAIITAINKSIVRNGQSKDTIMDDCKRYGIDCLHEITSRNVNVAIEAGAKKFLQDYPIEGYANIEAAIQDKEYQPENYQLIEIFSDVSRMEETMSQVRKSQARRDQANASNHGRTYADAFGDMVNTINNNNNNNNNNNDNNSSGNNRNVHINDQLVFGALDIIEALDDDPVLGDVLRNPNPPETPPHYATLDPLDPSNPMAITPEEAERIRASTGTGG